MEYKFDEIKHIHTLDGSPLIGTSSMSSVLSKPLTWWASGLCAEKFGWINKGNKTKGWTPKEKRLKQSIKVRNEISSLSDDEYLKLLDEAYSAHSKKLKTSATSGTDMHSLMENYIKDCIENNNGKPNPNYKTDDKRVMILINWSIERVKRFLYSEAHCFSKELWLGGISDVGFEDVEGKYAILDFKSSKAVYLSQFWQCIGYAMQIEENGIYTSEGELVKKLDKPFDYVAVLPFGMKKPTVKYNYDMEGGKDAVRSMVLLYNKLNIKKT